MHKMTMEKGPYMDTNQALKNFLKELCINGGLLQEIIICWSVPPTLISLPLFRKKFQISIFSLKT